MLSFMVSEAAHGVNIAEQYPAFHQRLLADPELHQRFQDSLDLLLRTQTNTLEPLPGPPRRDLSFLQTRPRPELSLTPTDLGGWAAQLRLSLTKLNSLFFPTRPGPVTRHGLGMGLDEDNWFTLFRETVATETGSWSVVLEGTPVDEPVNSLKLALMVVPLGEGEKDWPCLQATLTWGSYQEIVAIDKNGRSTFPLLAVASVLGETGQSMKDDLSLRLVQTVYEEIQGVAF